MRLTEPCVVPASGQLPNPANAVPFTSAAKARATLTPTGTVSAAVALPIAVADVVLITMPVSPGQGRSRECNPANLRASFRPNLILGQVAK